MKFRKLFSSLLFAIFALVLLQGAGKCFGQDSTAKRLIYFPLQRNILIVESTQTNAWFPPQPGYFRVRYKVKVVSGDSGTLDKGHIQFISDSSIFINGKEIKLKDIASIKKVRGEVLTIGGSTTFAIGAGLFAYYYSRSFTEKDYYSSEMASLAIACVEIVVGVATLVGIIQMASAHRYYMDQGWKFDVKPDLPIQSGMMRFPSKSDTVRGNPPFNPGNNMTMPNPFPKKKKKPIDPEKSTPTTN